MRLLTAVSLVRVQQGEPRKETAFVYQTKAVSFQRNKSLAGFVKCPPGVKYGWRHVKYLRALVDFFHFTFRTSGKFHNDRRSLFRIWCETKYFKILKNHFMLRNFMVRIFLGVQVYIKFFLWHLFFTSFHIGASFVSLAPFYLLKAAKVKNTENAYEKQIYAGFSNAKNNKPMFPFFHIII